jgi:hypothetical protein
MGVESIHIPEDFPLNERLRRVSTSVQTGEAWYSAKLGEELDRVKYPLCFMDFETVGPAVPCFAGMRPTTTFLFSGRFTFSENPARSSYVTSPSPRVHQFVRYLGRPVHRWRLNNFDP